MPVWLHLKPEQVGKGRERKKINIVVPFRSHQLVIENSKKIANIFKKIKKYHYGFISSQNWLKAVEKERK